MQKSLLLVAFLCLTACADLEDESSNPNQQANAATDPQGKVENTISSRELEENIAVTVSGASPEKYTVQFSWPTIKDDVIIRIRLGNVLSEISSKQKPFFTHTVSHNQHVTYAFDVLDAKYKHEQTILKNVEIPWDLVVKNENSLALKSDIRPNRLFLSPDVSLRTMGELVQIVTKEIHSKNGVIETFSEHDTQPSAGQPGKGGGSLIITAEKLFGTLTVKMRGQKGGRGAPGAPHPQAATGSPSGPGEALPDYGAPGTIGRHPGGYFCKSMGPAASKGVDGTLKGNTGGIGYPGGDSGNVRVTIKSVIREGIGEPVPSVNIIQIPGEGGDGGEPGEGQKGGEPGTVGGPTKSHYKFYEFKDFGGRVCYGPASNERGANAPAGDQGPRGPDGKLGSKCLTVESEGINECRQ